ncbi:MAG TPA: ABC transporter ATP-binding protein [Rectinemataceae bacterium]|nr:ABC transporter ATP-binding protein [Rectinemataceae bacterium]
MEFGKNYKKKLASYIGSYKGYAIPGLLVMIVISLGRVVQPLILKEIIDKAVPTGDSALLLRYALAYLAVIVVVGGLTYYGNILISKLGLSIVTRIKEDLFAHLLTLPVAYFDAHPVGELMSRTENDTEKVRDLFSNLGVTFIVNILMMGGMFAVTFSIAPTLALIMLAVVAVILALMLVFFSKILGFYDQSRNLYAKVLAKVTEFIQGMEIVKVFDRKAWAAASLDETGRQQQRVNVKVALFEISVFSALESIVGPLFIVALILLYAPRVIAGGMSLGTLLLFFEYGASLLRPVLEIAESIRRMQQAKVSLNRILTIMSLPEEPGRGNAIEARLDREIRFENLWFAYKDEDWILKDISFSIPKGSLTAVVGSSGSGKSTTVSLLCGFYRPQKGRIAIDGVDLDSLNLASWRKKTGLVLQDVYLFPGSVLENVRVYNDDIPDDRVEKALRNVYATDMVSGLPSGLQTNLWERGGNLSSGEKQLLAFARALAADPELVILDEATSNIDMDTEEKIRLSLDVLLAGRTALIVAHRLSSILHADQILYFSEGRIVARGTHAELFETLPEYRRLVEQQFLGKEAK